MKKIATLTATVARYEEALREIAGEAKCVNDDCACCPVLSRIARAALAPTAEANHVCQINGSAPCCRDMNLGTFKKPADSGEEGT